MGTFIAQLLLNEINGECLEKNQKKKYKDIRKEKITKPGVQIIERRNKQKYQEFTNQFEGLVLKRIIKQTSSKTTFPHALTKGH